MAAQNVYTLTEIKFTQIQTSQRGFLKNAGNLPENVGSLIFLRFARERVPWKLNWGFETRFSPNQILHLRAILRKLHTLPSIMPGYAPLLPA